MENEIYYDCENNSVVVPENIWKEIQNDLNLLEALFDAGVDSWDGYEFALDSISDKD